MRHDKGKLVERRGRKATGLKSNRLYDSGVAKLGRADQSAATTVVFADASCVLTGTA